MYRRLDLDAEYLPAGIEAGLAEIMFNERSHYFVASGDGARTAGP